jgi:3-hydroxyacyl-[acyl-carrier-protein] dehydratase
MEVKLANMRRNFVTMEGKATVDGKVVCELEASAAIVPKEKA